MKFVYFFLIVWLGALSGCTENGQETQSAGSSSDLQCDDEDSTNESDGKDTCSCTSAGSSDPDTEKNADTDDWDGPLSREAFDVLMTTGLFVEEGAVFTTSYNEGYNLNFEISEEDARSVLPDNLTPVALKLIESDEKPRYYVSWYLAVLDQGVDSVEITRVDTFTYARTSSGALTLYFISSYMKIPDMLNENDDFMAIYEEILEFFARDSRTGEPAYPHYYTEVLEADHDTFKLVYGDASIEGTACDPVSTDERFSLDFVAANSQIYRTAVDKNVNYFNQDFILTKVETRDLNCITSKNLTDLNPLFENLVSVQFYGSKDKEITWFYQMCENEVCFNPFE